MLVTGCGLGMAPVASGTFGSLGGIALAIPLQLWLDGGALAIALGALSLVLLAVGCSMTAFSERTLLAQGPQAVRLGRDRGLPRGARDLRGGRGAADRAGARRLLLLLPGPSTS